MIQVRPLNLQSFLIYVNAVSGSLLDARFHVVPREQTRYTVHHSLPPPIVILFQHINYRTLLETQFILLVSVIIVNRDHYKSNTPLSYGPA